MSDNYPTEEELTRLRKLRGVLDGEPELRAAYEAGRLRFTADGLLVVVYPLRAVTRQRTAHGTLDDGSSAAQ